MNENSEYILWTNLELDETIKYMEEDPKIFGNLDENVRYQLYLIERKYRFENNIKIEYEDFGDFGHTWTA